MKKIFPLLWVFLAACGGVREKQVLLFYQSATPEITQKLAEIVNVGTKQSIRVDTSASSLP